MEENFDPDYEWNEWKLRQQALSLADIRRAHPRDAPATSATEGGRKVKPDCAEVERKRTAYV